MVPPLGEIYEQVMATELSLEKWQIAFDTQARAFFICARTAAKFMSGGGRIIGYVLFTWRADRVVGNHGWPWDRRKQRWIALAGISRWRWDDMGLP